MVGLDKTRYEISEEEMELEVFVIVRVPDIHCPVTFPFNVTLHTEQNDTGGLARKLWYGTLYHSVYLCTNYSTWRGLRAFDSDADV